MAFVPNFKWDVFVSYAHLDNEPFLNETFGWITTLIDCVAKRLGQKLGQRDDSAVWMDPRLTHHEPITEQIMDAVRQSAILLVVQSPAYVGSEWCCRERNAFLDHVRQRSRHEAFVVEREPVGPDERPKEFGDLLGYRFWTKDKLSDKLADKIHILTLKHDEELYLDKVEELCTELCSHMRELRNSPPPSTQRRVPEALLDAPSVFLAQVTDDLDPERDSVKRYLSQFGIRVIPTDLYSLGPDAFRASVAHDLSECKLFAQLLSEFPGKKPPDLPTGYVQTQIEMAQSANKPILQWRRPDLNIASISDSEHRRILEASTVHAESIEDFKTEIKKKVFETPKVSPPSHPAFVFVDMESSDRNLADQVCKLLDELEVDYVKPAPGGDPESVRKDLEQNLAECDVIVIVYGTTTAEWVRSQLLACRKSIAARSCPLKALALFDGPPYQP